MKKDHATVFAQKRTTFILIKYFLNMGAEKEICMGGRVGEGDMFWGHFL